MNEYIFSGADASTPLAFPLPAHCKNANFEVNTVEISASTTRTRFRSGYDNWMENEEFINGSYG